MAMKTPPVYIVWSTDQVDLSDPFQRRWYIQQRQGDTLGFSKRFLAAICRLGRKLNIVYLLRGQGL